MSRLHRMLATGCAVALVTTLAGGCGAQVLHIDRAVEQADSAAAGQGTAGPGAAGHGTALEALRALPVKGRAPRTGYTRARFGQAWKDVDHDGCDQRNQVLARDLTGERFKPGTHDCVVLSGRLSDPYTGRTIAFSRGARTSTAVQIDHVVALSDAWQTGAQQLPDPRRAELANDTLELVAVDGPTNEQG